MTNRTLKMSEGVAGMSSKNGNFFLFFMIAIAVFPVFLLIYDFAYNNKPWSFKPYNDNIYQRKNFYPQKFKIATATVVKEAHDGILIHASAFIIDKQKGWFATAAHFAYSDNNKIKIFYNGIVYGGALVKISVNADVAILKINGKFNADNFTESYKFASGARAGEKVFIKGLHFHPRKFWVNEKLTGILRFYYNDNSNREVVFDDLVASVTRVNAAISLPAIPNRLRVSDLSAESCVEFRLEEDHQCSFGGLSGSPIINVKNELVGILFASGPDSGYRIDLQKGNFGYISANMIYAVPAEELIKLMQSK